MNNTDIVKLATDFIQNAEDNYISKEIAISPATVGMKIYENPIFAFGDAQDPYFMKLKDPEAIGSHFRLPQEWLPQANTVISFFLPYTAIVKDSNSEDKKWPSDQWLHGRFEGQKLLNRLALYLQTELKKAGYLSIIPSSDENFWSKKKADGASFTSNWSERHVAYVCGLGTFGLSKGLITSKGMAGRFGSIVTDAILSPSKREYDNFDQYCTKCGDCISQCPVKAISFESGKNDKLCSDFLNIVGEKSSPRYGCGKCQVGVSCESCIPAP